MPNGVGFSGFVSCVRGCGKPVAGEGDGDTFPLKPLLLYNIISDIAIFSRQKSVIFLYNLNIFRITYVFLYFGEVDNHYCFCYDSCESYSHSLG